MNKHDLVSDLAAQTDLSRRQVHSVVDATLQAIMSALEARQTLMLLGFGTFTAVKRKGPASPAADLTVLGLCEKKRIGPRKRAPGRRLNIACESGPWGCSSICGTSPPSAGPEWGCPLRRA